MNISFWRDSRRSNRPIKTNEIINPPDGYPTRSKAPRDHLYMFCICSKRTDEFDRRQCPCDRSLVTRENDGFRGICRRALRVSYATHAHTTRNRRPPSNLRNVLLLDSYFGFSFFWRSAADAFSSRSLRYVRVYVHALPTCSYIGPLSVLRYSYKYLYYVCYYTFNWKCLITIQYRTFYRIVAFSLRLFQII